MGGGGLVILPKKSWNVWNYDNRERVRRDEQRAKEDEAKRKKKQDAADQERRLLVLRARARGEIVSSFEELSEAARQGDGAGPAGSDSEAEAEEEAEADEYLPVRASRRGAAAATEVAPRGKSGRHINFFADVERKKAQAKNKDHEAEQRRQKIEEDKRIGALVFLGQTVADAKKRGQTVWYEQDGEELRSKSLRPYKEHKRKQRIRELDPLKEMQGFLKRKREHERDQQRDLTVSHAVEDRAQQERARVMHSQMRRRGSGAGEHGHGRGRRRSAASEGVPAQGGPLFHSTYQHFHAGSDAAAGGAQGSDNRATRGQPTEATRHEGWLGHDSAQASPVREHRRREGHRRRAGHREDEDARRGEREHGRRHRDEDSRSHSRSHETGHGHSKSRHRQHRSHKHRRHADHDDEPADAAPPAEPQKRRKLSWD